MAVKPPISRNRRPYLNWNLRSRLDKKFRVGHFIFAHCRPTRVSVFIASWVGLAACNSPLYIMFLVGIGLCCSVLDRGVAIEKCAGLFTGNGRADILWRPRSCRDYPYAVDTGRYRGINMHDLSIAYWRDERAIRSANALWIHSHVSVIALKL